MSSVVVRNLLRIPKYFQNKVLLWDLKYASSVQNVHLPSNTDSQSVILPGPDRIRASNLLDDPSKLVCFLEDNIRTVYDIWNYGLKLSDDGECLGTFSKETKKYEWIKYSEVMKRAEYLGSALISLGVKPRNDSFIGLYSKNRNEFIFTNLGCITYSMVPVPLYDTLGMDSLHYIINEAELNIIICDTSERASLLLEETDKIPTLKSVIIMDEFGDELKMKAHAKGISTFSYSEFEEIGKNKFLHPVPPNSEDLYTISYTSGTTGPPKGVLITHCNIVSSLNGLKAILGPAYYDGKKHLSYLPAAHIYEICNQILMISKGGKIGFYSGDIKNIFDDILKLQPSFLPLVPRLMNRIYTAFMDDMKKNPIKRFFWNIGLKSKENQLKRGILNTNTIWDKFLFKKLQSDLGGNTAIISTTSAPVSSEVIRFFRLAAGCQVYEAYGQTETGPITKTLPYETGGGSVGPPLPSNHIKLVDVPEMGYLSKNDTGEVCVRGPNVFKGYFKNPIATKNAIDKDGWLHTGDIGRWLANGALAIIDRKKHLLKLSQGEYVAPEKVENVYSQCDCILQIYVDGFSEQDYLVSVVIPEKTTFIKWAKKKNFDISNYDKLCADENVRATLLKELHKIGKANGLNSLEQVKNIRLLPEPMTIENGLLTPSLKIKRVTAKKHFSSTFNMLYQEGPLLKTVHHVDTNDKNAQAVFIK